VNKLKVYVMAVGLVEDNDALGYVEITTDEQKEGIRFYITKEQTLWYGAHLYQWVTIGVVHATDT